MNFANNLLVYSQLVRAQFLKAVKAEKMLQASVFAKQQMRRASVTQCKLYDIFAGRLFSIFVCA